MGATRGGRALVSVLPVMLLACGVFAAWLFLTMQRPTAVYVGRLSDFPPSADPYFVDVDNDMLFVVNTGSQLLVLEPRFHTSDDIFNCDVKWVPTNERFEDPCSGAKFTPTGEWIEVSYLIKTIDQRGLSRYPVEVRGDELWLTAKVLIPGRLIATAVP
ncbi:MAG: hypothetical protein IT317_02290 [Anaerolineales bacterium]|nr:hypothetical protein [Anaerolineales bacterium]